MGHEHNTDPDAGPVCSHLVTVDQLTAWGHPVRKVEKVVGSMVVVREGDTVGQAVHAAWCEGRVQICTRRSPAPRPVADEAHIAAAIAWADAHRRPAA